MSCEGTGLGAPGPRAGYWEKIQERSASLETCPWCAAKGQTRALRSYRISIQEVITLCTDPQCLFPLVSRPLEDVLASLVPPLPQTQTGRKRKSPSGLEIGDSVSSPKSARSEEAVSQNESRPVVRITSSELNGEDCFHKMKHTVQKERIGQSEPTDMELVDKTLNYPLPERGGANGYHRDSDWPIPEEMDQNVLDEGEDGVFLPEEVTPTLDKGLPLPEKTVPTSQLSFVDAEPAPKEVICPLDEAVSAPEKNVDAPEKVLAPRVTVPNLQDTVCLLEALPVPGEEALPVPGEEALPVPGEEALPVPGEEALPVPGEEALPVPGEEALPVPGEAVSLLGEALPVPGEEALPAPGEAVSLLGEAVSLLEEALPVPGEAVSLLEEAPPVPGEEDAEGKEPVPTMEAVLVLQEALTVLEEASPGMKEGLSVLQKEDEEELVLIASEEEEEVAALVALEAVSIPAMVEVVPALEKDEEDLLVFDGEEKIQDEERPPQGVCRPCSVDLSQSKVHDGQEDDGPIRARRRAHNARQLSDEDEEQEVSVKEEVEVLTPAPKKKRGRPRKTPIIKYTQEVLPDFDPGLISTGELVPVPGPHLFWKNEHSLGWLDTLLVALVHCRTLRDRRPIKRPTVGQPVWDLCERYDRACSLSTAYQHTGADGVVRVPSAVSQRVQTEMQAIRTAIFKLLEPLLKCKLGQNERLVFVLPLLLGADSWAERLFQHECDWQFQCNSAICQHATQTKCNKTLTTFTKVVSDWHPLNAANQSRCCKCNKMKQARMLVLERLSPVFVLHFAEGLPDNDLSAYSFTFQQQRYSITTVLQYDQPLNHLVSWIRIPDGSWLEFDDLKHPDCVSHTQLAVPPREIHVVFWELETDRPDNPQTPCSSPPENLTSTSLIQKETHPAQIFVVNESLDLSQTVSDDLDATITADDIDNNMDTTLTNNVESPIIIGSTSMLADVPFQSWSHDLSLPLPLNDTAVVEALTVSDNTDNDVMDTAVTAGDPSIGSATLLDTFEGLSHDDIVTLTLVEVKMDSESRPLDDITPAPKQNGRDVCFLSAPGSETPPLAHETTPSAHETSPSAHETTPSAHEVPTESETDDEDVAERPTSPDTASEFLPDSSDGPSQTDSEGLTPSPPRIMRRSNRPKMASNAPVAAAAKVVTTPMALSGNCGDIILPSVVSVMSPSYVDPSTAAPSLPPPPHPKTPNTPNSLQSTPSLPPPPHPNSHWSYLLSRHPTATPTPPGTQRQPSQLNHSTPNRFQQLSQSRQTPKMAPPNPDTRLKKPPPLPKARLSKEDNEALPVKAAEMYGGFQARSRNVNINNVSSKTSPPTQLLSQKTPSQPVALASRKPPIDNTAAAYPIMTSLPSSPGVTELHKISSSRNQGPGGQVPKVPAGLSETEALRYKLLKKLKAKKKKLEKLNQKLGFQAAAVGQEVTHGPDCADLRSPSTVSSSTSAYDGPAYDEFFADLLSPATTASNLSPDSTGFLDMLTTNGQEGGGNLACGGNAIGGASQMMTTATLQPANHGVVMPLPGLDEPIMTSGENFLEEFISGSANQQMKTEALSAFDLFF